MLKFINSNEYRTLLGISSVPSEFDSLCIQASYYINQKCFGRIDLNNIPEEVKYVTCLLIRKLEEKEFKIKDIGNIKSENIEGWGVTYQDTLTLEKEYENEMYEILKRYLWNVLGTDNNPLLYIGAN